MDIIEIREERRVATSSVSNYKKFLPQSGAVEDRFFVC